MSPGDCIICGKPSQDGCSCSRCPTCHQLLDLPPGREESACPCPRCGVCRELIAACGCLEVSGGPLPYTELPTGVRVEVAAVRADLHRGGGRRDLRVSIVLDDECAHDDVRKAISLALEWRSRLIDHQGFTPSRESKLILSLLAHMNVRADDRLGYTRLARRINAGLAWLVRVAAQTQRGSAAPLGTLAIPLPNEIEKDEIVRLLLNTWSRHPRRSALAVLSEFGFEEPGNLLDQAVAEVRANRPPFKKGPITARQVQDRIIGPRRRSARRRDPPGT